MSENNILGVILAGGKSKRFGKDKSLVFLDNKTLLEHTLEKIESIFFMLHVPYFVRKQTELKAIMP